jgi:hypothetical protein
MKTKIVAITMLLAMSAMPALAQYKEINKVETLAKTTSEQQMLTGLSTHLGIPSDMLKKEMTSNSVNFGQLYLAHAIARASKSDVNSIFTESKTKLWTTIIEERKVDKKQLEKDVDNLEKALKSSGGAK